MMLPTVDLDDEAGAAESFSAGEDLAVCESEANLEPYVGMEFESEEAAKEFYDDYARKTGFIMRLMSCHRSEVDGKIIARRLGCNKEGYSIKDRRQLEGTAKSRPSLREGCKAMLLVRANKTGVWVVTKFVKEHNHPLVIDPRDSRAAMDLKDRKINELTAELRNKKRQCASYREQLNAIFKDVEEHSGHLSKNLRVVIENLKEFDPIEKEFPPQQQPDGGGVLTITRTW